MANTAYSLYFSFFPTLKKISNSLDDRIILQQS